MAETDIKFGKCTHSFKEVDKSKSLQDLIDHYLNEKIGCKYSGKKETTQECHVRYLDHLEDITDFICGEHNEIKIPDGPTYKVNNHQRSLRFTSRQPVINDMAEKLKDIQNETFNSFEELYDYINQRRLPWFGDTCVYDFALRYGWHLNPRVEPEKYVYLHSKPKAAAEILKGKGYFQHDLSKPILFESLRKEFKTPGMKAIDVEHFLCCYKKQIEKLPHE